MLSFRRSGGTEFLKIIELRDFCGREREHRENTKVGPAENIQMLFAGEHFLNILFSSPLYLWRSLAGDWEDE